MPLSLLSLGYTCPDWCRRNANPRSVEDEGIGIEEDYHEKVFKIFQQLSRKPGGVGIGLAHCKKIALMHEGDLWIDNTYADGCRFCFTLAKAYETFKDYFID